MAFTFLKNLFDRIFHPILFFLNLPHTYPIDSDAFGKSEFPPRTIPISVGDWRDLVEYLHLLPFVAGPHHVVEIGRYRFEKSVDPRGEHQVVVAKVEVERGLRKLLRIEQDTVRGSLRVGEGRSSKGEEYTSTNVKAGLSSSSGTSSGATQVQATHPPTATSKSPHPSLALYSSPIITYNRHLFDNSSAVEDEENNGINPLDNFESPFPTEIDTVQSIFPSDLQKLILVESVQPQRLYLHHLSILAAEVAEHEYVVLKHESQSSGVDRHRCTLFADLLMRVVEKEFELPSIHLDEGAVFPEFAQHAVDQILDGYRRRRDDLDRRHPIEN